MLVSEFIVLGVEEIRKCHPTLALYDVLSKLDVFSLSRTAQG